MSYARSPSEGDVYVIGTGMNGQEWWECMTCDITPAEWIPEHDYGGSIGVIEGHYQTPIHRTTTPGAMHAHLTLHRLAGQRVPDRAFELLAAEQIEWQAKHDAEFEAMWSSLPKDKH